MPGYHLHFISDDLRTGGHILDLDMAPETLIELDITPGLSALLPNSTSFANADLSRDMSGDLVKAGR